MKLVTKMLLILRLSNVILQCYNIYDQPNDIALLCIVHFVDTDSAVQTFLKTLYKILSIVIW